jgi:hypothetical protein
MSTTTDREVARILGEACGAVSMCWDPKPTGWFDSAAAARFVNDAVKALTARIAEIEKSDTP